MNTAPSIAVRTAHDDTINQSEAAELLGISPITLQRLRTKGGGPPFRRHGLRRVLYSRKDVRAWSEAHRFNSKVEESARKPAAPSAPHTAPIGRGGPLSSVDPEDTDPNFKGRMVPVVAGRDHRKLPPRPPLMRDDDVPFGYLSDRASDADWFAEHPSRFRILSTINSDKANAGIGREQPPAGFRAVRLARHPGAWVSGRFRLCVPAAIVFLIRTEGSARLNKLTDPELVALWLRLLGEGHQLQVGLDPHGCDTDDVDWGPAPLSAIADLEVLSPAHTSDERHL